VRLVDEDEIKGIQLASTPKHRLDAGDDDGMRRLPSAQPRRVDAEAQLGTDLGELVGGLLEQLLDMRQNEYPATPQADRILAQRRDHGRLATGGGDDHTGIVVAGAQIVVDGGLAGRNAPNRQHHTL
jgi:hypothetical protein